MKIYKILNTKEVYEFFGSRDVDTVSYWTIKPPKKAKIVKQGKDKNYDTLYAITYNTDSMSISLLMKVMFEELQLHEVKSICQKDKYVEKLYMNYLQNPSNDEKFVKALKDVEDSASSASSMASLAFLSNIFD